VIRKAHGGEVDLLEHAVDVPTEATDVRILRLGRRRQGCMQSGQAVRPVGEPQGAVPSLALLVVGHGERGYFGTLAWGDVEKVAVDGEHIAGGVH
jgi:hypothetical protein